MTEAPQILVVLVTMPDKNSAEQLARSLVENRLAACVNLLAPCRSIYRWQGAVEQAEEIPLLIKTARGRYPELEAFISANHPYDVPEIIALPLMQGLPQYLNWVEDMTATESWKGVECV